MPDLRSIAEFLTAIATLITAIIAALKASSAKESSDDAAIRIEKAQTDIRALINQTQAISQTLLNLQTNQTVVVNNFQYPPPQGTGGASGGAFAPAEVRPEIPARQEDQT